MRSRFLLPLALASAAAGCSVPQTQAEFERQNEAYWNYQHNAFIPYVVTLTLFPAVGAPVMAADFLLNKSLEERLERQQAKAAKRIERQARRAPPECQPLRTSDGRPVGIPSSATCAGYYQ